MMMMRRRRRMVMMVLLSRLFYHQYFRARATAAIMDAANVKTFKMDASGGGCSGMFWR